MRSGSAWLLSIALAFAVVPHLAVACDSDARPFLHVIAEPTPVQVASDFSLSEISTLAHRVGTAREQAPLGFYISTIRNAVDVQIGPGTAANCMEHVEIQINVELSGRRIEIGREAQQEQCRYVAALRHYQKKADADRAVFANYVKTLTDALRTTPLPDIHAAADSAGTEAAREALRQWVKAVIERTLPSVGSARLAAFRAVDTDDEMRHLAEACTKGA
jgi:hypothetical protein